MNRNQQQIFKIVINMQLSERRSSEGSVNRSLSGAGKLLKRLLRVINTSWSYECLMPKKSFNYVGEELRNTLDTKIVPLF